MPTLHRITLSIPTPVATDLRMAAKRLGVSQSGLLVALLTPAISQVAKLVSIAPPRGRKPSAVERRRFRGESIKVIKDIVGKAVDAAALSSQELDFDTPRPPR